MKEKIIINGGCGYIGSHTVIELLLNNYQVVIIDDLSNSNMQVLDRIYQITSKRPIFENIDLKDSLGTRKVFQKHKDAEAVIHFAAHKAVSESVQKPLMYYRNNLYSLINVLIAQKENNIKNFIFSSSATVYGNPDTLPISEANKTKRPFSPYGNTKKMGEEILEDFVIVNHDFSVISLRYFNPIGAHESGLIGELPHGIPNNLLPFIAQTAAGVREKLHVFGDDYPTRDGTPIRDYIHVVDIADAHVKAIERLIGGDNESPFEVFNLGSGTGYTVLEIIDSFESVTGIKLNYEISKRRSGDVPKLYASSALAEEKLGWKIKRNLTEMIESSWKWEQNLRLGSN